MGPTLETTNVDLHALAVAIATAEASGKPSGSTLLPADYEPRSRDVCCGRGKRNWNHEGNVWFRNLIHANVDRYIQAPSKADKTVVVFSIVELVRSQGALFVKQDDDSGRWYDIGDTAREKVGHSLRDQVTAQRKKEREGDNFTPSPSSRTQPQQNFIPAQLSQLVDHQSNAAVANHLVNEHTVPSMMLSQIEFPLPQTTIEKMIPIGITPDVSQSIEFLFGGSQPYTNVLQNQHIQTQQFLQLNTEQLQALQPTPIHPQLQHQFRNMYQQPPIPHVQQQKSSPPQYSDYGYDDVDYNADLLRRTRDDHDLLDRRSSRDSVEVLEKFGRRPSWRAMSISSSSGKGLVNDIQDLQAEFGDDLFDDYVFDRRRSSIQPFSFQTGANESRRMSAMSMCSAMGDSFGDMDSAPCVQHVQFSNNFRSSIRRSSVNWMKEVQHHLNEFDRQQVGEAGGHGAGGNNRRASAFDMLKVLEDMDYDDDDDE